MQVKKCIGKQVKIFNPGDIWVDNGSNIWKYDGLWIRGILEESTNYINPHSIPTDGKNFILVEVLRKIILTHDEEHIQVRPETYKAFILDTNSYIASFKNSDYKRLQLLNNMEIYLYPNTSVEIFNDDEKTELQFIVEMFPVLSVKYPNESDESIIRRIKNLYKAMW